MKALITGATGFTGKALTRRLHRAGMDIKVLVRDPDAIRFDFPVETVAGDIRDPGAVNKAVAGVQQVFHLAAVYRSAGIQDRVYWDVHVRGTRNLLAAALEHQVQRFVHCSTVGVHGHVANGCADEQSPYGPGDIYQVTKLQGELSARLFHERTGLAVTVIRPCAIYGPGDTRLLKLFKLASRRVVPIIGTGRIYYHMIYIDDLAEAFYLAANAEDAVGEVFIIGGEKALTLLEIISLISRQFGVRPMTVKLPAGPFQAAGDLCERICIPLGMEPPIYRRRVDFFTKSRIFDCTKATQRLSFTPAFSTAEGIAATAAWYREHRYLP